MTDSRTCLLRAALGFTLVPADERELRMLHRWLDCWRGVGDVGLRSNTDLAHNQAVSTYHGTAPHRRTPPQAGPR